MKVDELLKRLENIKIDKDERHEIAEYLAQTVSDKDSLFPHSLMTKDRKIYDFDSYVNLLKSNKISPDNAFVYVKCNYFTEYDPVRYFYPFLLNKYLLIDAYLSKLGLEADIYRVVPATGLKYVVVVSKFSNINRVVVEVADIDNVATNMNLPTIYGGIRNKHINDDDEVDKIVSQFRSQKIFAGYNYNKAWEILDRYYENHATSLAKKVEAIKDAYNRIFQPYRVVYDLKTKQFIPA